MSDYISREAAFDAVRKVHNPNTARAIMSVVAIREVPAADVVEVVRCRECKQWYKECDASWPEPAWGHCDCDRFWGLDSGFHTPEYFFCADGKRKEGADNG